MERKIISSSKFSSALSIAIIFCISGFLTAQAATLDVVVNNTTPEIGQPVRVDLPLDTQGDDANAIQGQILFPADQFTIRSINDGASPVSFWIESPAQIASGVVAFSGIIPGGFEGDASSVVSLWLIPTTSGAGVISLDDVVLLRNDGQASPIAVATTTATINVSTVVASSTRSKPVSLATPETFTPVVSQDPNLFGGQYFLAFSTTDKGSGIAYYQVLEVPTGEPVGGSASVWQTATSPYLLQDQSLESNIYVRAVDNAGNFIVVEVPAAHPVSVRSISLRLGWIFFAAGIILILFAAFWLVRIRRRHLV